MRLPALAPRRSPPGRTRRWRGLLLSAMLAGAVLTPAIVHASVPECEPIAKALAERRFRHWLKSDAASHALPAVSDSIGISITSAGDISFFDVRAAGRVLREKCDTGAARLEERCIVYRPERRSVPVSSQPLLDAAVMVRRHNALGSSTAAEASRIVEACGKQIIFAEVPFNRGIVAMRHGDSGDPRRDICMNGATYIAGWRNQTRDGGLSWSLEPAIGWCPGMPEPSPAPRQPPTLRDEITRGTPGR